MAAKIQSYLRLLLTTAFSERCIEQWKAESNTGLLVLIKIKPLSVNRAWQGRRFKTPAYRKYQNDVITLLRPLNVPDGDLEIYLKFGFSSKDSDFDNPVKLFVDCLQKRYGFNDNRIKRAIIEVDYVNKGDEYTEFNLKKL